MCLSKDLKATHSCEGQRAARHERCAEKKTSRRQHYKSNSKSQLIQRAGLNGRFTESEINVRIYGERQKSGDLRGKHSGASFHYRKNKKEDESGKFKWSLRMEKNTHFRDLHHFSPNEASLEMRPSN